MSSVNHLPDISSFWTGPPLGWMQKTCLTSFVKHGHKVTIYTDNPNLDVPDCIEKKDASEIWQPNPGLWKAASPVLKSDLFRLKLFQNNDSIWVDTDAFCTRPFLNFSPNVFGMLNKRLATGILRLSRGPRIFSVHFYGRRHHLAAQRDPKHLIPNSFAHHAYTSTRELWETS